MVNPLVRRMQKVKIRQLSLKLTFDLLDLSRKLTLAIVSFRD